jgi:hypothetical protein
MPSDKGASMTRHRTLSISPTTVLAVLALFFALGGSAFAVGEQLQALTAPQQRCANGAVRGVATVVGDANGIANVPDKFTSRKGVFARTFNCTGRGVQVRRTAIGIYEVRFVGNAAPTALASGIAGSLASVQSLGDGTFRVNVYPAGTHDPLDLPFTIVVV